jgi:hypothetical protein
MMPRKTSPLAQAMKVMENTSSDYAPEVWHHWRQDPLTNEYMYMGVVTMRGSQDSGFFLTPEQHDKIMTDDDTIVERR